MNSTKYRPGVITRSMAAKRKAEEAENDAAKKSRLSEQPTARHQQNGESCGAITRSMATKLKLDSAEEKKTNDIIAKRGTLIHQRLLLSESTNISSKKLYFSGPYNQQQWSLPESIMYYIITNPTAKSHQKLIQCCKYFFAKLPIFLILDLKYKHGKWQTSTFSSPLDIAKIAGSELWISGSITMNLLADQNILSSLIPKINRCDIQSLYLSNQTLSHRDFMSIASAVENFCGLFVTVNDDDGAIVPFEKLIEALPKAKIIDYWFNSITSCISPTTFNELVKIRHFSQLHFFYLHNIPETFDLDAFHAYMKKNKITNFYLQFDRSVSEAYKNRLESIIDEIIDAQTYDYNPPYIYFSGLDSTKKEKLYSIYRSY